MNRLGAHGALVCFALAVLGANEPSARTSAQTPSPLVRLRAALERAEAHDAEAIPILIDLLAELPRAERRPAEEYLSRLAGEWAPLGQFPHEDEIGRRIHRDAWRAWWRATDG